MHNRRDKDKVREVRIEMREERDREMLRDERKRVIIKNIGFIILGKQRMDPLNISYSSEVMKE